MSEFKFWLQRYREAVIAEHDSYPGTFARMKAQERVEEVERQLEACRQSRRASEAKTRDNARV